MKYTINKHSKILGRLIAVGLMLLAVLPLKAYQDSAYSSTKFKSRYKTHSYKSINIFSSFDVKYKGEIEVTDDDEDIKSISAYGYLRFSKTAFGNRRRIEIEADADGKLIRDYYVGGQRVAFDPEGREWMADVLIDVIRYSGIGAEGRVKRILKQEGVEGVVDEIAEMESNSVMTTYFSHLLEQPGLSTDDIALIARAIYIEMSSNTQRADLYREYDRIFLTSEEAAEAYFRSVGRLSSNTERSKVLRQAVRTRPLTDNILVSLLEATAQLSSNTETGAVLREVNTIFSNREEVRDMYFSVVDGMSSNTEKGSVLRDLLKRDVLIKSGYIDLYRSVENFSSNTEAGSVLKASIRFIPPDKDVFIAFFEAVNSLSSNTETGSVLRKLLRETRVPDRSRVHLFKTVGRMSSNTERGSVLRDAVGILDNDEEATEAFFNAVGKMSSNTEMGSVLRKLAKEEGLNSSSIIGLLEASEELTSNTEKGEVLVTVSQIIPKNNQDIKDAYIAAAETLTSDSEYRRVMDHLYR